MKFIKLTVKNHTILHGFDNDNKEILEKIEVENSTTKLIAIDRIKSLSKNAVLTDYAHNRLIFWEYEENFEDIISQLEKIGALISVV